MADPDPLHDARLKLGRAQHHLDCFNSRFTKVIEEHGEPYGTTHGVEANGTRHVFRFQADWELPENMTLIVGDVIQNARNALDHIVFALAHHQSPRPLSATEERKLQFPICGDPADFQQRVAQGWL